RAREPGDRHRGAARRQAVFHPRRRRLRRRLGDRQRDPIQHGVGDRADLGRPRRRPRRPRARRGFRPRANLRERTLMATHTRYFRWDDASAPTLSGTAGSLLELLRACLVGTDGVAYGSGENEKLAAGWTEEFTGTNVAVFRNSLAAGGTGDYFRIDDNGIAVGGAREAMLTAYNTMSDIDTGTGLMPPA